MVAGPESMELYTSTGVNAPWVMEQPSAPATAKREYRSKPWGFFCTGSWAAAAAAGESAAIVKVVLSVREATQEDGQ